MNIYEFLHNNIDQHNLWKREYHYFMKKMDNLRVHYFFLVHLKGAQLQRAKILIHNKIERKLM